MERFFEKEEGTIAHFECSSIGLLSTFSEIRNLSKKTKK
jgi:hypothetical protein